MALEKYEFPATGAVTASWLPTANGTYEGWREGYDEGMRIRQTSGKSRKLYESGIRFQILKRFYQARSLTEWNSYVSFRNTVAGQKFKFTDDGGAAHTVTFEIFFRDPQLEGLDLRGFEVVMREEF